jgi:undecaprenyl-diphosphatase
MSDLLSALLLGILEGLTEFLPISSTGHLLIAQHWLGARSDFFNIVIQAGAIVAVVLVFRQRLLQLATGFNQRENREYVFKLGAAFLVTAVVGLVVRKAGWSLPETVSPVAWALIIGGVWMLLVEAYTARLPDRDQVTWTVAIGVGLAQVVAGVFPGTSRSASAIFLAMLLGLSRRAPPPSSCSWSAFPPCSPAPTPSWKWPRPGSWAARTGPRWAWPSLPRPSPASS